MQKKYELDDQQSSRLQRGLKVRVLKVGKVMSYADRAQWYAAGSTENIVVLREGASANTKKEVQFSDVEEVWHRSKNTVFLDGSDYKVTYE